MENPKRRWGRRRPSSKANQWQIDVYDERATSKCAIKRREVEAKKQEAFAPKVTPIPPRQRAFQSEPDE
jgi:hypothetical protein